MREVVSERRLRDGVEKLGGRCFKVMFAGVAGAPDRLVLLKGKAYFAELKKSKGGRLEASQKVMFPILERLGFPVRVLHGNDEVDDFINFLRGERETVQRD